MGANCSMTRTVQLSWLMSSKLLLLVIKYLLGVVCIVLLRLLLLLLLLLRLLLLRLRVRLLIGRRRWLQMPHGHLGKHP